MLIQQQATKRWHARASLSLALVFLILILSGCGSAHDKGDIPYINLAASKIEVTEYNRQRESIKLAIASIISPSESIKCYDQLIKRLEEKLDKEIEVVQRNSYSEVNDLLRTGRVDIAFVCTYPYLLGAKQFGLEALVIPEINKKTSYKSYIIVRKSSGIDSFAQLKGKVFAFTDPMSTTGYFYPQSLLAELNTTDEDYFRKTFFTYSHDNAMRAVARGLADGGAVEDIVFENLKKNGSSYVQELKIIKESQEFYPPPVVVRPGLEKGLKEQLRRQLLSLDKTPEGRTALKNIGVDRYVLPQKEKYSDVETLIEKVTNYYALNK